MDNTVIASIVSAIGGIVVAVITAIVAPKLKSGIYRNQQKVPIAVLGKWKNEWQIDNEIYDEDTMEITKWKSNNTFTGKGFNEKGDYIISGEVFSSNYVIGFYRSDSYPAKGYLGSFTLKLSVDGKSLRGAWQGFTINEKIEGGTVICRKI